LHGRLSICEIRQALHLLKVIAILASVLGILTAVAGAQITPLTEPLAEEKEITITCELTEAPRRNEIIVFDSV
jgi:hypothetical protein